MKNGIVGKENAKFARRAPKAWSIRGNFSTNSGVVDAIFCASSTPDARVFGSARATDSMQHFCDVRKFSQRCRLKLWSIARRHAENLKTNLRIFWRKNCAMAASNARFLGLATRRRLALEPWTSYIFQIGIISEGTAKFGLRRASK